MASKFDLAIVSKPQQEIECEANAGDRICLFEQQVDRALTNPRTSIVIANPSTFELLTREANRATTIAV